MSVLKRLAAFSFLLIWCAVLLGYRIARTESSAYTVLVWNLALASVPQRNNLYVIPSGARDLW